MTFKFEFDIDPVAKGRPRLGRFGVFTPDKTRNAEANLRWLMSKSWKRKPIELPIALTVVFNFLRPKSVPYTKRAYHTVKPDCSNLLKLVEDAGNGILWRDDSQIINLSIIKAYGERGKITLGIETFGDVNEQYL